MSTSTSSLSTRTTWPWTHSPDLNRDLVGRIHGAPDRELGHRNHALRLVADVHEHLVLVHPDDLAVDALARSEPRPRRPYSRSAGSRARPPESRPPTCSRCPRAPRPCPPGRPGRGRPRPI